MISKKEFYDNLNKSEIKRIENIFRQIVEEKPYLMINEKKFYMEAERIYGKDINQDYAKFWLSGRRKRK